MFQNMSFGGTSQGGLGPSNKMKKAAKAQEKWMGKARDERIAATKNAMNRWETTFQPYQGFGGRQTQEWESLLNDPSSITSDPGYQFRLNQGREAVENNALARGGFLSGNTAKAVTEYGQDYASNEYDKALGRREKGAKFGATVDTNYANALSNLEKEIGNIQSDFYGGLSNYAFWHEQQGMDEAKQWMGWLRGAMGGFGGGGGGMGGGGGGGGTQRPQTTQLYNPQGLNQNSYQSGAQQNDWAGNMYLNY